jgi:hypothetical protein
MIGERECAAGQPIRQAAGAFSDAGIAFLRHGNVAVPFTRHDALVNARSAASGYEPLHRYNDGLLAELPDIL